MESSSGPVIRTAKLKGHQGAVLCLDHSSSSSSCCSHHAQQEPAAAPVAAAACLLSGSEDQTCRLWDLRDHHPCRASLCIQCPGEVLSVAFFRPPSSSNNGDGDVDTSSTITSADENPLSSIFARDYSVYAAVDNTVYGYDLRKAISPIVTEPTYDLTPILEAPDEINQVAFSPPPSSFFRRRLAIHNKNQQQKNSKNKKRTNHHHQDRPTSSGSFQHLATADDAGTVRVTSHFDDNPSSTKNNSSSQQQVYCHGENAMVTALAFLPKAKTGNKKKQQTTVIASGGTDSRICLWDVTKNKQSCDILIPTNTNGPNQVCNPPFVHSLAYSPSGRILAAGLGDGSVGLFQQHPTTTLTWTARLEEAHGGPIASVLFPEWESSTTSSSFGARTMATTTTHHDRLLCSAGNDGCLVLWDLGSVVAGDAAEDPATLLHVPASPSSTDLTNAMQDMALSSSMMEPGQHNENTDDDRPKTLFAWRHERKPNWVVSSRAGRDPVYPSSLFVADTFKDITIYSVPLI